MLASSAPARAQDVRGGFLSLASASVSDLEMDRRFGYPAISLEDFRRLGFTDVEARAGVVTAMVEGASLEFYIGSPFFRFRRTVLQLPNPPYQADGTYWVPASLVTGQATSRGQPVGSGATAAASAVSGSGGESGRTTDVAASPAPSGPPRPLRVAIDPGHGGRDPGTTGRRGTREKNVVLAIAKLVHAELSAMSGVEPMLTRDRDVLIPLKKRSQLAVAQEADLFLSIHANASRSRKAQGFETFFLGEARTELSRELAIRENSAVQYEEEGEGIRPEDVQFILAQLNLTSNQRESGTFGGYVQNSLRGTLRTPDRGVKQNGLWVLVGATGSMPSILVEVGFLSNDQEEKFLRSKAGQQSVADAIVDAIAAYRDDYRATDILSPIRHRAEVISSRQVATDTCWLELDSPEIADRAEWGQFVMIGFGLDHLAPPFLPRPFSVGWRAEDGRIGLLVRAFGAGSRRLAELRAREHVLLLGPLGRPFRLETGSRVACVAGGVGLAPFLFLAGDARRQGFDVDLLYGELTADKVFDTRLIEELTGGPPIVWTEDGSVGRRGRVTEGLSVEGPVTVLACGPTPMLRALAGRAAREGFDLQVSVEEHMGCGVGTCQGCVVQGADGRWRKACTQGPVFYASELTWSPS
jgi:N-acetylmuramoyl-L-alanine amidase/ferredoxin-NADP reductase